MALLSSPQPGLGGELVAGVVTRADPACPAVCSLSPLGCIPHGHRKASWDQPWGRSSQHYPHPAFPPISGHFQKALDSGAQRLKHFLLTNSLVKRGKQESPVSVPRVVDKSSCLSFPMRWLG